MVSPRASSDWLVSQVLIYDRKLENQKKLVWTPWLWRIILFGIPLIIIWGILGVYIPVLIEEVKYQARSTAVNFEKAFPNGIILPSISLKPMPSWVQGYALEIPKLSIQETVVDGVDAGDKNSYMEALTRGIAHAGGTGVPGKPGLQYYFAHSSGLPFWGGRAVTFATLYKLEKTDRIIIYKDGYEYNYQVIDKKIVNPDDVSLLNADDNTEKVVLQTCWPLGTNWQRLLVIAERI